MNPNEPWVKLVELVTNLNDDRFPPPTVEIASEERIFINLPRGECATYYWHDGDWQLEEGSRAAAGRAE